jgi:hypothetical protein
MRTQCEDTTSVRFSVHAYDQISATLIETIDAAKDNNVMVRLSTVFAAELLLDIRSILGEGNSASFEDLITTANGVSDKLDGIMKTCERVHPNEFESEQRIWRQLNWIQKWSVPAMRYMGLRLVPESHPSSGTQRTFTGLSKFDREAVEQMWKKSPKSHLPDTIGDPDARAVFWKKIVPPAMDSHFLRRSNPSFALASSSICCSRSRGLPMHTATSMRCVIFSTH